MSAPAVPAEAASRSSFYAGMRVLPKPEREAMYAIYGFCRIVDDIADDQQGDRATRAARSISGAPIWPRSMPAAMPARPPSSPPPSSASGSSAPISRR
jgi:hypothetical protein